MLGAAKMYDVLMVAFSMLDGHAAPTLARVMRIQPLPHEKPAQGFSWADYEDVRDGENDADGEDDGWGVVASKKSSASFHLIDV